MEYTHEYLKNTLYTAILCDVMDQLGYKHQALGDQFRPLDPDVVLFGRAFTSIGTQVYSMPENPLTAQCKVIDQISEGEVYVLVTRGEYDCALMGELLATAIQVKKGAGALIDGRSRDLRKMKEMGFPLYYKGSLPLSSKGRCEVSECKIPIKIDGVLINPGDYIFADLDGVAIIPQDIAEEVFTKALEIVKKEDTVRENLLKGATLADTYAKIGAM
ncbi:MAG: RraA family protein [Synergistaceae bacterium]|jgi:regulator of RNase E activity RraA|nr:RraA family protein [Synergistaceae bacterium]